jgi:hypothetical protein
MRRRRLSKSGYEKEMPAICLYDAMMRFTTAPDRSFNVVDWEAVAEQILHDV